MKKILSFFVCAAICATVIFSSASCGKDENKCATVACGVGTCKDGTCECPTGYGGPNCLTIWMTKYVGGWSNYQEIDGDALSDIEPVVILKPSTDVKVILADNFLFEEHDNVILDLVSSNSFKFRENQELEPGLTIVSGTGTIDELGIKITGSYKLKEKISEGNEQVYNMTFTFEKQ